MDAILRALSRRPCAITEEGLHLVLAVVSRDEFFGDVRQRLLAGRDEDELDNDAELSVVDGTAIIPIKGPLFAHANLMTNISGATSYQQIHRDLRMALDDSSVKRILFSVDSPGGDANGVSALADFIFDSRGKKPMRAFVTGQCASAALWLMSQVDRIDAAETAYVGSIGVISALIDTAKADEQAGVRKVQIVSSRAPNKRSEPIDGAVEARVQQHCDELEAVFMGKVARGRGVNENVVVKKFGQGDSLIASKALAVGLIDGVGNYENVLQRFALTSGAFRAATEEKDMRTKKAESEPAGKWICPKCDEPNADKLDKCAECGAARPADADDEEAPKEAEKEPDHDPMDDDKPADKAARARIDTMARGILETSLRYCPAKAAALADARRNGVARARAFAGLKPSEERALLQAIDRMAGSQRAERKFGPGTREDDGRTIPAFQQTPTKWGPSIGRSAGSEDPVITVMSPDRQRTLDLTPNQAQLLIAGACRVAVRLIGCTYSDAQKFVMGQRRDWQRAARGLPPTDRDLDIGGNVVGELPMGAKWVQAGDANPGLEQMRLIERNLSDTGEDTFADGMPNGVQRHR